MKIIPRNPGHRRPAISICISISWVLVSIRSWKWELQAQWLSKGNGIRPDCKPRLRSTDSCEIYNGGGEWTHLVDTSSERRHHSSAVKENRILLIGGFQSKSTVAGAFRCQARLRSLHPSAIFQPDFGNRRITEENVTSYQLSGNGDEIPLTPIQHGRHEHACGVYQDAGGQQVRRLWIHWWW